MQSLHNMININWTMTESIKKCTIRSLIQRYLGQYLSGELNLSQLNFELYNGKGSVSDIPLAVDVINQEVSLYVPFKLTQGRIGLLELAIPWSALWTEPCSIHVSHIELNFCKLERWQHHDPTQTSILSKSLMTSSMEIAEEIINQEANKFEGLEKFAQLISNVIRRFKLSAHDIRIKFLLPNKRSGAGMEIEIRIGDISLEEEEISLDEEVKEDKGSQNALSDIVTKRITVEGIEVLINDVQITKLLGKHTVKVQFDGNRIDVEAYLGAYILAILNSDHLKVLHEFIKLFDSQSSFGATENAKPLTARDYRFINEILHTEGNSLKSNPMTSSMLSYNNKNWTSDSTHEDEDRFMPFNHQSSTQSKSETKDQGPCVLACNFKMPGIIMCLISSDDNMPVFGDLPAIGDIETFIGINVLLNDILREYRHIRMFASSLCLEISPESLIFSCINVSVYEYYDNALNTIVDIKESNSDTVQPSVKLKMAKNEIEICLTSTSIKLDLTLIERHYKLFDVFSSSDANKQMSKYRPSNGHQQDDDLAVTIECEHVDIDMYFPIPDLRPERDQYSSLHDEILSVELHNLELRFEASDWNLVCSQIGIDISFDQKKRRLFHARSDSKELSLHFSTCNPMHLPEPLDNEGLLKSTNMMESVFLTASTLNPGKTDSPFQVKRKMCGAESFEQMVTPGDRDHTTRYLNENKDNSKFYLYINVPMGEVYFEDKAMFELIYNRFVNDLVLWTPYFPKPKESVNHRAEAPNCLFESNTIFTSVTADTVINFDRQLSSESSQFEASSSLTISENVRIQPSSLPTAQTSTFFSCQAMGESVESMASDTSYHSITNSTHQNVCRPVNEFLLELEVSHLNIEFFTESGRRSSLFTQDLLLGIVVGPDSERKTNLCLCADGIKYNCNNKPLLSSNIFSSDSKTCTVNMAMDIKRETDLLKKIKLAVQLERALLLGLDLPVYEELFNFVNLKDDDILGYICPKVVLELHTDIVKSGISFDILKERPTLLHCEDIYLTSMVIENTNQTILRFFIEEALLSFKRNNLCQDTMKNYITVIDSGVIDLNLTISKDGKLVLKVSNNIINIKVCPDSLTTLCQFLQSFAAQVAQSDPSDSDEESAQSEIFIHKNSTNDTELIADAMSEPASEPEKIGQDFDNDDDSNSSSNCDKCKPLEESTFLMLGEEDDYGSGINFSKEPQVRVLTKKPIKLIENYFAISGYNTVPEITSHTLARYFLEKMSLHFALYGGKDFDDIPMDDDSMDDGRSSRQDVISQANMSMRSGKSSINGHQQKVRFSQGASSVVWEDINISTNGYGTSTPTQDSHYNYKCSGGANRKNDMCVQFNLDRIKLLFDHFDKDYPQAWNFWFSVEEVEILDFVSNSQIKKILYEYVSESNPRRKHSNMFSIKMSCNRNFQDQNEECDLRVKLKNLRVNIDQDTLFFMMDFFATISKMLTIKEVVQPSGQRHSSHSESSDSGSVSSLKKARCDSKNSLNDEMHRPNEDILTDEDECEDFTQRGPPSVYISGSSQTTSRPRGDSTCSNSSLDKIFIKEFQFINDVLIRLDYNSKHLDLTKGTLPGMILGLAHLNQSELTLKKLCNKHGMLGFEKVLRFALGEWTKDIKRNQLPSILSGVGPMHAVIQLFQGFRDLLWLPIDQYRRDQRIVRGLQRGSYNFSIHTAMATIELCNRVLNLIQATAQITHDLISPRIPGGQYRNQVAIHYTQPRDLKEGLTKAYTVMREGMHDIRRGVSNATLASDDLGTIVSEVVRVIPSTLVRPIGIVSHASSSVLVGIRNQLTPEARKDDHEKWKNANER